jgi:hypothetical protein
MQHLPSKRVLTLILGLAAGAAGSVYAQDTTDMGRATMDTAAADTTAAGAGALDTTGLDTTRTDTSATRGGTGADTSAAGDTSQTTGVQNPPGYRGMERDTTMFPPSDDPQAEPGRVEDRATGTYEDSAWKDTTGAEQNPAGYRGMERPVEGGAADTTSDAGTTRSGTGADTSEAGDTSQTSGVQNPPGYRGMERDTTIFPTADKAKKAKKKAEHVEGRVTGAYSDSAWQDTTGAKQNPPGYRGMERPVGEGEAGDTTSAGDTMSAGDTTSVGDTEPKVEDEATPRLDPSESGTGDTNGQSADSIQ